MNLKPELAPRLHYYLAMYKFNGIIEDTNKDDISELDFSYVVNKVELDILPGTPLSYLQEHSGRIKCSLPR